MTQKVLTQIDQDGNATVALNRPEVHNAFDPQLGVELIHALKALEANPKVRAVVLMGQGKSFSAGADIEHMRKSARFSKEQNRKAALASAQMFHTLYTLRKPTIARVHGAVRGGGVGLVAACDIALGSRDATFRLSEVRLGIIPAMISPYVIAAIGERYARLGYSDTRFNLRMTRLDLGSFLGLTQETISRALSGFSEAGVIRVHNKELQLLDVEKLHQIVAHSRHSA
jgi:methylglutaconyl-CoA hydratase